MKLIVLSYYPQFRCIADRCRHSCCVGWNIAVDDDSVAFYESLGGDIGDRLREAMTIDEDGDTVFCMTDDKRCPFLRENGLCELILSLGEGALCQICRDHPRFRFCFGDREELGLGLCCEAAASLIVNTNDPVTFVAIEDDGEPCELSADEAAFLQRRDELIAVAQDRTLSVSAREDALLTAVGYPLTPYSPQVYHAFLAPLERLDAQWDNTIAPLKDMTVLPPCDVPDTAFEQLLCYFLFRHLPYALDDDRFAERTAFAVHSVRILRLLCTAHGGTTEALCDAARQYSAEIEYSDENIDRLLDVL